MLAAVPPGVVIPILPVFGPVGTVAVISAFESTLKLVALTPAKVTLVAPVWLSPGNYHTRGGAYIRFLMYAIHGAPL